MNALVLSAVIAMTSVVTAVGGNSTNKFAYNCTVNHQEQVESQTVFRVEDQKFLHYHLLYNFTYDHEGRVATKEVLKWNEIMQAFEKQYYLNFEYTDEEVSIEYAAWSLSEKAYSDIREKVVYQTEKDNSRYLSYEWNKKENQWKLVMMHDALNGGDGLLADK